MQAKNFLRKIHLEDSDPIWIIIPCYNEGGYIEKCLDSFTQQTDQNFKIIVVDNNSTDNTSEKVKDWMAAHSEINTTLLKEPQKGIGFACVAGCKEALAQGATMLARTDADCLAHRDWVHQAKSTLVKGYDFTSGKLQARSDERRGSVLFKSLVIFRVIRIAVFLQRLWKAQVLSTALMPGGNLAITAELYTFVGGFPVNGNEDLGLTNRVLGVTKNGMHNNRMIIYTSLRRIQESGFIKTLQWYSKKGLHQVENT